VEDALIDDEVADKSARAGNDEKMIRKRFALYCKTKRIGQTMLSSDISTPFATVNRWYNEGSTPSIYAIYYLIEHYGMNLKWLVTGEEYLNSESAQEITEQKAISCSGNEVVKALEGLTLQMKELTETLKSK